MKTPAMPNPRRNFSGIGPVGAKLQFATFVISEGLGLDPQQRLRQPPNGRPRLFGKYDLEMEDLPAPSYRSPCRST
jgi:hypothetical protein